MLQHFDAMARMAFEPVIVTCYRYAADCELLEAHYPALDMFIHNREICFTNNITLVAYHLIDKEDIWLWTAISFDPCDCSRC